MDLDVTVRCRIFDEELLVASQRETLVQGGRAADTARRDIRTAGDAMLRLIATGRPIPKAGPGFEVAEIVGEPEFCDESIKVSAAMRHAGAAAFSYDERFDTLEDVMVAVYRAMEVARLVEDAEATLRRFRDGSDD